MIEQMYTQDFTLYRKTREKNSKGVIESVLSEQFGFKGIISPKTTVFSFESNKETYTYTDVLYCPIIDIRSDDVVEYDELYDVVEVINPMSMDHHLKVLLNRRK